MDGAYILNKTCHKCDEYCDQCEWFKHCNKEYGYSIIDFCNYDNITAAEKLC